MSSELVPQKQREFAVEVVRQLREAGFEAYWAGGCVRDRLLGRDAKDFDVATSATPKEIRRVFRRRRTLTIGAAFGVITVLGPREAGQIEVTTFRQDAGYSDGRHPDSVTFTSAEEDASRRDFTINGLFYDPIEDRIIDFVGGREDLDRRVIRAIGRPHERFAEDKLRMLRAIRFAACFDFHLDPATLAAVREMAEQITVVSPERIAMEMRRMLVEAARVAALRMTVESRLAAAILPELLADDRTPHPRFEEILAALGRLRQPGFPLALGALLSGLVDPDGAERVCRRWRLSNNETHRACWLVEHQHALRDARRMPWSRLQPLLVADGIEDLLALCEAVTPGSDEVSYCRTLLAQPRETLDPKPLLSGDDLLEHGVPSGPRYRWLLTRARAAQLDGEISTRQQALELVDRLL